MAKRLHELDSLRGLAAFSVLLSHVFLVFPVVWNTTSPEAVAWPLKIAMFSPFRTIWAGHEAVVFFFILSGFVLALPFFGGSKPPPYKLYLAKRILRIYPPYLAAALAAIAMRQFFFSGPVTAVSDWFNQSWQTPPTIKATADHLLMVGSFKNCDFNPVLWSLVHEMRISIIFPLIIWGLSRSVKLMLALPPLFTFIYWLSIALKYRQVISFDHDYFDTLHYMGFFIVGAFLAKHRGILVERTRAIRRCHKWLFICSALLAYSNAFWLRQYFFQEFRIVSTLLNKIWFQEWVTAYGVIVIIVLAISTGSMSRFLSASPLRFLGSISYSLYLFHAVVLKILVTVLAGMIPLPAILCLVVIVSIVVATLSWRMLEVPSIELGRKITTWWYRKDMLIANRFRH